MRRASKRAYLLHGLVLGRGRVSRRALFELLGFVIGDERHHHRFDQHIHKLHTELDLDIRNDETVVLEDADLDVDLWNVIDWTEGDSERSLDSARKLLEERGELCLPVGFDECDGDEAWKETLAAFERGRERAFAPRPRAGGAAQAVRRTRDALLARPVAPGVSGDVRVRDVVDMAREIKGMRHAEEGETPRPVTLADGLEGRGPDRQTRLILTGGAGAGKTVTAILTYLELAERFEAAEDPGLVPVYFDGLREGFDEGFAGDDWFRRRLADAGVEDGKEPIVVLSRADAFLAHADDLPRVLSREMFRVDRLLLCCGQTFYDRQLVFNGLDGDRIELGSWSRSLQEDFAEVAFGAEARAGLAAWLEEDPTREELCAVPLHLVFVLGLLQNPDKVLDISTAGQLFDAVAWVRFGHAAGAGMDIEARLAQLGRVAHHYYQGAKATTGGPIRFKRSDLRAMLKQSGDEVGERHEEWAEELEHHTLLVSNDGRDLLSFEHPIWGQFFVARHIVTTLIDRPAEALPTFAKFLSLEVVSFCEDLLADADLESVREALIAAMTADAPGMEGAQERIAREQVCYFLGAVGHRGVRAELLQFVDPGSDLYEEDNWIRRGILFGLADGGDPVAADMYVDALRAEREAGGSAERDTNVGFHLTFRGDQDFDLERPDAISRKPQCVRTVAGLVRGLGQERHACSRRIKLFTLLELAAHPQIPAERFDAAIEPELEALAAIRERLAADSSSASWPELAELDRLLEERRGRS